MGSISSTLTEEAVPEVHQPHWASRAAFPIVTLILLVVEIALLVAINHHWTWLCVLLMLICSHLMHGQLIGFHEASHSMLRQNRLLNEIDGLLLGALSFMSFSLYRAAHQTHHAFLASERDEELWPFVHPSAPRWLRVLAAFLELSAGLIFTPAVFIRTFFRKNSPIRARKVRRRIWIELIGMVIFWTAIFTTVTLLHLWPYFLWMYLGPAIIAGNLQSWRKYIEHVGMTGNTPTSATRSIVNSGPFGKLVSFTLLHEPFHGVHHIHAGVPHAELSRHTHKLEPKAPGEMAPFPSYRHAFWHLLKCLADPRVGGQWHRQEHA